MLGRTDSRARLLLLLCFLGLFAGALTLRLAYWQIGEGDELRTLADQQLANPAESQTRRGEIVDSRGSVLATTAYRDRLAAYPDLMNSEDRPKIARRLGEILGMNGEQVDDLIATFDGEEPDPAPQYTVVARRLTVDQSDQVRDGLRSGELSALELDPQPIRFYPNSGGYPDTTLASQLLGFVTDDGQGRYGIEQFGQDLLAGTDAATADLGADLGADAPALPQSGEQVQLTIDSSLQLRLEKELYAAWVADQAPRVTGLVMDPYTGAILAWASVPGYDANDYVDTAENAPELFADPIVSQVYEPGSVMKMFTAAAALEEGVVNLNTPVADGRVLRIGPDEVRNGDLDSIGIVPFQDIIARSRNVGVGKVALNLGNTTDAGAVVLYDMWQRLGIGRPTGIELGNESTGIVADPLATPWQTIDLVNRAFGQGVAVTPLQLARGFSAMINGGQLVTPHLVESLGGEAVASQEPQQVMETSLSEELRELMIHVVEAGPHYAAETLIPNYVVGGKTGTAQIWDQQAGAWKTDTYNHTFIGFVGSEKPEAVILVRIHDTEPHVKRSWGMTLEMSSNELFRRVAMDAITTMDIPPLAADSPLQEAPVDIQPYPADQPPPPNTIDGP